jgi:hypothetical protein
MKSKFFILFVAVHCFNGCTKRQEQTPMYKSNTDTVIKISVLQSGKLLANGAEIGLDELDGRLSQVKSQDGKVMYYREEGQGDPPSIATDVIKLIIKHRLPVMLSSKPDFSDAIDEHGVSHPR